MKGVGCTGSVTFLLIERSLLQSVDLGLLSVVPTMRQLTLIVECCFLAVIAVVSAFPSFCGAGLCSGFGALFGVWPFLHLPWLVRAVEVVVSFLFVASEGSIHH